MSPAFSSPRQAGAFAFLLSVILLLPVLAGKSFLPPREQVYSSMGRQLIDYPNFHQQVFEEKGDIDIAFMSSSRMVCSVNAAYVQDKLSEKLGRPAVVCMLTWTWNGYDALYFLAQDLLKHRKVHMIVFCDLNYDLSPSLGDIAHRQTSHWFRFADNSEALNGLPLKSKLSFYASAVLGMPRNLVGLLRSNLAAIAPDTNELPWNYSTTDYTPQTTEGPSDVYTYSDARKENFQFADGPVSRMQRIFVRKIGLLAQAHQTQLVCLHLPDFAERKETKIDESAFWPKAFGTNVPMVGIPPASLFAGLTDDQILELYHNPTHFNQNGCNYFTPLITPSLIQIYEDQNKP
jgi:hypothetical protein